MHVPYTTYSFLLQYTHQVESCKYYWVYIHSLQWLKEDFLSYLDKWSSSVKARKGFTKSEKAIMTLSKETLQGLKITGKGTCMTCTIYSVECL